MDIRNEKVTDEIEQRVKRLEEQARAQAKVHRILSYAALGNAVAILILGFNLLRIVFRW